MSLIESVKARGIRLGLRASFKITSRLPVPLKVLRGAMGASANLFRHRSDVDVRTTQMGDVSCELVRPNRPAERVILHFHGGAFFGGSAATHRSMMAEIAVRANAEVYVLNYRLAPEHPYPAAPDDGLAAYKGLLAAGHQPESILLSGDSAGGALAVGLAVTLREQGIPQPAGMFLISPYVDMTLNSGSVQSNAFWDPMLTKKALLRGANAYRGNLPANDPRISPLFADLQGIAPMLIQVGEDEILLDDALKLAEAGKQAGVWVDCRVYPGMWHVFQMFGDFTPVAGKALNEIAGFTQAMTTKTKKPD